MEFQFTTGKVADCPLCRRIAVKCRSERYGGCNPLQTAFRGTRADLRLPRAQLPQKAGTQGCRQPPARIWGSWAQPPRVSPAGLIRAICSVPEVGTRSMEPMGGSRERGSKRRS